MTHMAALSNIRPNLWFDGQAVMEAYLAMTRIAIAQLRAAAEQG